MLSPHLGSPVHKLASSQNWRAFAAMNTKAKSLADSFQLVFILTTISTPIKAQLKTDCFFHVTVIKITQDKLQSKCLFVADTV